MHQIQKPLFEGIPTPPPAKEESREAKMKRAFERQKEDFKVAFKRFAEDYILTHDTFLVAEIVAAYDASKNPKPVLDYRCIGGLINGMVKRGVLSHAGHRKAEDGSGRIMPVYGRK